MAIADLLRDPGLIPADAPRDTRDLYEDFIRRRVRVLFDADHSLRDEINPRELSPGATPRIALQIGTELGFVRAAHNAIWTRVQVDRDHMDLDPSRIRARVDSAAASDAPRLRRVLVSSIVFQASAHDFSLADPANLERLHELVDRRLRIVERMLYDVGRVDPGRRRWRRSQINEHRTGPWPDGRIRMFEYPRVPRHDFHDACRPAEDGTCQAPLNEWHELEQWIKGPIRANPTAATSWRIFTGNEESEEYNYALDYVDSGHLDAVAAIRALFRESPDYQARNLFFCDHVIHALHLEALVFAKTKRRARNDWLADDIRGRGSRFLRLSPPFASRQVDRFLGCKDEPLHFESRSVNEEDLQIGDHLIIYNHPAYEHATRGGPWKLENAVVVETVPRLRMQGHGSRILTKGQAWQVMVALFNEELELRRSEVEAQLSRPDETNWLLRTPERPGYPLLRTAHGGVANRGDPSNPRFTTEHQRADWYVVWQATEDEARIREDPVKHAFVNRHHLVEYTDEGEHTVQARGRDGRFRPQTSHWTLGWFPLWTPTLHHGRHSMRGGRINATQPVRVGPRNIAGWTWFMESDPDRRDIVPVIRPRVG